MTDAPIRIVLALVLILLFPALPVAWAETILYVATDGRDDRSGTREAPLQSLAGARDRIRQLRADGHQEPVTVRFAPGRYEFTSAVEFTHEDSGTREASVVYQASPDRTPGAVRLTGGRRISGWTPVTDTATRQRLVETARAHVRVADLAQQGITDWGQLTPRGFAMGSAAAEAELFYNDRPMTLARWPNEGFRGIEAREGTTHIRIDTDRLIRWTDESDPWLFAYWHHDWAELHEPIVDIQPDTRTLVRSSEIKPQYGITPARARWYADNLLSELDSPGE